MGMGDSDNLTEVDGYLFEGQAAYLDSFIDCAVPVDKRVVLVVHDWGSSLGYHWAYRHQDRVQAIAYMEGSSGAKNFCRFGYCLAAVLWSYPFGSWRNYDPCAKPLHRTSSSWTNYS